MVKCIKEQVHAVKGAQSAYSLFCILVDWLGHSQYYF